MCFTFAGRLQTRLIALIGPLFLACAFVAASGDRVYFTMFSLMAVLALALDAGVYHWLIDYQPRWLTIALGAVELGLLVMIAPQLADLGRMAGFYVPAWLSSWLTLEVVLPLAWPRWMEDGGELRPVNRRLAPGDRPLESISVRRKIFATSTATLLIGGLPWIAGAALTPPGHHFTGVVWWPEAHLPALGQVLSAVRGAALITPGVPLGSSLLHDALWLLTTLMWLFGVRRRVGPNEGLPWPAAALLVPLFLPISFVALVALAIWLLPSLPWRWLLESAAPKLMLALLVIGAGVKLWTGELMPYHALLILVVFVWLFVFVPRSGAAQPIAGLVTLAVSPLVLPAPFVALLALAVWPFLRWTWHWLPRSVIPALALAIFLVWNAAQVGALDALSLYHLLWIGVSFAWLIGVRTALETPTPYGLIAAALVPLTLPMPIIALLAAAVWTWRARPRLQLVRALAPGLALIALIVWGVVWAQVGAMQQATSAPAYLAADRWAMAQWLREDAAPGSITPIYGEVDDVTLSLGGREIEPDLSLSRFWLASGAHCIAGVVRFQQGGVCLVESGTAEPILESSP